MFYPHVGCNIVSSSGVNMKKINRRIVEEAFRRLLEGKSYREIAEELGISASTVHYLKEVLDYAIDNAGAIIYRLRRLKEAKSRKNVESAILPSSLGKASAMVLYAYYVYNGWRIVKEAKKLTENGKLDLNGLETFIKRFAERFIDALTHLMPPKNLFKPKLVLPKDVLLSGFYSTLDELERLFVSEIERLGMIAEKGDKPRVSLVYIVDGSELGYSYNYLLKIPLTREIVENPAVGVKLVLYCIEKLSNPNTVSRILSIIEEYMKVYNNIVSRNISFREAMKNIRSARRKAKREIRKLIKEAIGEENIGALFVKTPDQLSSSNRVNITIYLSPQTS